MARVRCPGCDCLLQLQTPPYVQTIRCPRCQEVSSFRLGQRNGFPPVGQNYHGEERPGYYGPPNIEATPVRRPPQPPPVHGRKRALLCGLSYYGHDGHFLKGSINDVKQMKFLLHRMGFPIDSILTLTEDEQNPMKIPTKRNMLMGLRWLVDGCRSGDSLVFYYTGHGSRVLDYSMDEIDGTDEALCPIDYETAGKLIDDEIHEIIVRPLPHGVTLHAIVDTSFSGTVLDLPFVCKKHRGYGYEWEDQAVDMNAYETTSGGLALCLSACADHESSADTTAFTGASTGALTYSFIQVAQSMPVMTYERLLNAISYTIHAVKSQHPNAPASGEAQLSSSQMFDIRTRQFVL